jgi:agmatinase
VHAREFHTTPFLDIIERINRRVGDAPLYISIDIDVLDPAHAPGTGTPEAGGLTSRELLELLRALSTRKLVGEDVVEVAPAYDHASITAVAAAHCAYDLVSIMSRQRTQ